MKVLAVGVACVDYIFTVDRYPEANEKVNCNSFGISGGGNAATEAVAIAKLGCDVELISAVGNDSFGKEIVEGLENDGVGTKWIFSGNEEEKSEPRVSPFSVVIVDQSKQTRAIIHRKGATSYTDELPVTESMLDGVDVLLCDGRYTNTALILAKWAAGRDIPIVVEIENSSYGAEVLLPLSTIAIFSEEYYEDLLNRSFRDVLGSGSGRLKVAIATLGSRGAVCEVVGFPLQHVPAENVQVIDTTGAGDVFIGAFCCAVASWCPNIQYDDVDLVKRMVSFANRVAGEKCKVLGGRNWFIDEKLRDSLFSLLNNV